MDRDRQGPKRARLHRVSTNALEQRPRCPVGFRRPRSTARPAASRNILRRAATKASKRSSYEHTGVQRIAASFASFGAVLKYSFHVAIRVYGWRTRRRRLRRATRQPDRDFN
jgi:hypothetical protein